MAPEISVRIPVSDSVYQHQRSSIVEVPLDSAIKEVPSLLAVKEKSASTLKMEGADIPLVGGTKKGFSDEIKDGKSSEVITPDKKG